MNAEQLKELVGICKSKAPCTVQFNPLLRAFERGDYETTIATFRGNRDWVLRYMPEFPRHILDNGVAKAWHENGALWFESFYKDGILVKESK